MFTYRVVPVQSMLIYGLLIAFALHRRLNRRKPFILHIISPFRSFSRLDTLQQKRCDRLHSSIDQPIYPRMDACVRPVPEFYWTHFSGDIIPRCERPFTDWCNVLDVLYPVIPS